MLLGSKLRVCVDLCHGLETPSVIAIGWPSAATAADSFHVADVNEVARRTTAWLLTPRVENAAVKQDD